MLNTSRRKLLLHSNQILGTSIYKMASQIPITIKAPAVAASAAAVRGKKRPGTVNLTVVAAPQSTGAGNKKKRPTISSTAQQQITVVESVAEGAADSGPTVNTESTAKPPPFKDPAFMHSGIGGAAAGKKNRTWKNLKQILALERTLPWKLSDPNYYSIDAPPSLKPSKKYSDISGLMANYTDPQTKLRFTSSEEFSYIRLLPTDVVTGYLTLRKATCIVP
ncbi:INO80 complex subunit C [Takifugu rubripes]|nr:INO80 complex subunit C [Takifugu rubripes]XP_056915411.1 INO80 complex subunit C [Takifugu flavidus]|eukprot:XP_003962719.2 PREDICTED: INO80 complex subunit C [Takifugu rubripes]